MAFEGDPSKPATSAKMTGVGNTCRTEGYVKVDNLREMPGNPLISVICGCLPRSFLLMSSARINLPLKSLPRDLPG